MTITSTVAVDSTAIMAMYVAILFILGLIYEMIIIQMVLVVYNVCLPILLLLYKEEEGK